MARAAVGAAGAGKQIAGIYIERHRIRAVIEEIIDGPELSTIPSIINFDTKPILPYYCPIDREDHSAALKELRLMAQWIGNYHSSVSPLSAIGIGSYGPFTSLRRVFDKNKITMVAGAGYGQLAEKVSPGPFTGVDLYNLFREPLGDSEIPIAIQTDANVAALGEAWRQGKGSDDVTVAIVLDWGTGGGFVGGNNLFDTALHPEMGRNLRDVLDYDPILRTSNFVMRDKDYIGIISGMKSMIVRAQILYEEGEIEEYCENIFDVMKIDHPDLWAVVAEYIANLCWICTVTLSPSSIVLGGPMARAPALIRHIHEAFDRLRKDHEAPSIIEMGEAPQFAYPELGKPDYISLGRGTGPEWRLSFGLKGAVYLAWDALRGGPGVIPRRKSRPLS